MLLTKRLTNLGDLFFRHRSYIPLGPVVLMFLQRKHFCYFKFGHFQAAIFEVGCFLVSLFGMGVRAYTTGYCRAGTSGRNTKGQYADDLNTDGIYSIVRNPLYIGNFFIFLGVSMLSESYETVLITSLLFTCFYIPIILKEEEFLLGRFKDMFIEYSRRTPAMLPNFKLWKKPQLKFNFIRVLYREPDSFMGLLGAFFAVEILRDYTLVKKVSIDTSWLVIIIIGLTGWLILKIMKKHLKSIDKPY